MSNNIQLKESAAVVSDQRYRLNYHLMPPSGWMNDPNGVVYYQGEYHVFYQHYPYAPIQGAMHWGHAKSKDLVHWEHLPIALEPSEVYDSWEGGGASGCWSGSAVDDDGTLVLMYTGHVDGNTPAEVQCIARSTDGICFTKEGANPVIAASPIADCFGFRDPKVWKHGEHWHAVIGSGENGIGKALLFRSPDLMQWDYLGPAAESDGTMGDMWECPDLFPLGEHPEDHVLIFSPMNMGKTKTMYWTGRFDSEQAAFTRRVAERVDYGFDFYAPQTMVDDRGRRIMFAWMNIWGAKMPEQEDGWMGAFALPRELKVAEDGTLRFLPVEELRQLRSGHRHIEETVLRSGETVSYPELQGDSLEIEAVFRVSPDASEEASFGFQVRCSEDGREYAEIAYQPSSEKLIMDRNHAGAGDGGISDMQISPLGDGRIKLHLFIDRTSLELFVNDGIKTMTNRIYPDAGSTGIKLFSRSGDAVLESLDVWALSSIWNGKEGKS